MPASPQRSDDEDDIPAPRRTIATNVSAPSLPIVKRRRTSRLFARPQRRPRQPERPASPTDELLAPLHDLSDVYVALHTLASTWPAAAREELRSTPPVLLRSQLLSLVAASSAEVDAELSAMAARDYIRLLRVPPAGDDAAVLTGSLPEPSTSTARRFLSVVLPAATASPDIPRALLARFFPEDAEAAATELVRAGWMTAFEEDTFQLAVPGMGPFVRHRAAGNKEILTLLRRAPYKEMLLTKLELRTLHRSVFTAQWHVRDVVGSGLAETVPTSLGTLVRLRETT